MKDTHTNNTSSPAPATTTTTTTPRITVQSILTAIAVAVVSYYAFIYRASATDVFNLFQQKTTAINSTSIAAISTSASITTSTASPSSLFPTSSIQLPTNPSKMLSRNIVKIFKAVEKAEGAGARVRRSIGVPQLRNFSPFLMLDHFTIGKGAGFPDHPHRGQETITYLLSGSVDHEDFAGGKGTINAGDLQFMTAGKGIVHAEMPGKGSNEPGAAPNVGMQLWVDLPKELKYCEPRYRDLRASEIPVIKPEEGNGKVAIKIISGESHGTQSVKDLAYTPVWILDITIQPGGKVKQELPIGWNSFMYTLSGTVTYHPPSPAEAKKVPEFHNVVFTREGDGVELSVAEDAKESARVILVAGMVLEQEVVQYGPFVVNSEEEVYKAMMDFQTNSNGFERAKGWKSEIGRAMAR